MSETLREKRQRAGRLGGLATASKYGSQYMAEIGRMGAEVFWTKYSLKPVGLSRYAIVERLTGKIINFLDGRP